MKILDVKPLCKEGNLASIKLASLYIKMTVKGCVTSCAARRVHAKFQSPGSVMLTDCQ